jgi:ABC-type transport system involved in multi-copper enzyme maturation permease subunit
MKAITHTEVYRRFEGELRKRPLRSVTLAWSGIRIGFKKKLPMLLLFIIPGVFTIVTGFMVQLKFEAEAGSLTNMAGLEPSAQTMAMGALLSNQLGQVEVLIFQLLTNMQFFVVLIMGWYGSGLIAEDRKLRAHLLYFARPMSRLTYTAGKLMTVMFWGSLAVVVPVTIVCSVASLASPKWSFLTERWDTILKLELYAVLWVFFHGILVLAISSLTDRRNRALGGLFILYFLTLAGSNAMAELMSGQGWRLLSIPNNFQRIFDSLFDQSSPGIGWNLEASLWVLGLLTFASAAILSRQTRKLEVGA